MFDENNEGKVLLGKDNKKYREHTGFVNGFPDFSGSKRLWDNYYTFSRTLSTLGISNKIENLYDKYDIYIENNEDENDNILDELNNLTKEYDKITKEALDNAKFYYRVLMSLYWDYRLNFWKSGVGNIYDETTTGIINLLNKNYIEYENKLVIILDRIKDLNLKLINTNNF